MNSTTITPSDIRELLRKRKVKVTHVAKAANVSPTAVYMVINGKNNSLKIAAALAASIGLPINQVFGDAYEPSNDEKIIEVIRKGINKAIPNKGATR